MRKKLTLVLVASIPVLGAAQQQQQQTPNHVPQMGNVGLGTYNPTSKLDVHGSTKLNGILTVQGDASFTQKVSLPGISAAQQFGTAGTYEFILKDASSNELRTVDFSSMRTELYSADGVTAIACPPMFVSDPFWTAGYAKLVPSCPDVNVGIGLLDPDFKLHVSDGDVKFDSQLGIGTDPENAFQLKVKSFNQQAGIYLQHEDVGSINSYGLKVEVNDKDVKALGVVDEDGFDVFRVMGDGVVWSTEINVDLKGDFPDYVFEDDYELKSPEEVDAFIRENGHLHNMPSAEEVAQNGINVAELQVQQTEKIEELYLHIISLNEQLKAMQEEIRELKAEQKEEGSTDGQ